MSTKKGLLIINTGDGKGKTTAAFGLLLRARAQGLRVCMIQFIKSPKFPSGEMQIAKKLGIEWHTMGDGFTWRSKDLSESGSKAKEAWALAQEKIVSGNYDLIVLDEFTYAMNYDWLDPEIVCAWIAENKPPEQHLVITGRDAPQALIESADLVTEMLKIKHPFDSGIKAQKGIEF